jgi:hypothetical protein
MRTSETIGKVSAAFVAAQSDMNGLRKDGKNPFFSSNYITLDSILEYVRPILTAHGIALLQSNSGVLQNTDNEIVGLTVTTRLQHSSGEWIENEVTLPVTARVDRTGKAQPLDPQSLGSGLTYGRRYALTALLGIGAEVDDDGNAASRTKEWKQQAAPKPAPASVTASVPANAVAPLQQFREQVIRLWGDKVGADKNQQKLVYNTINPNIDGGSIVVTPEGLDIAVAYLQRLKSKDEFNG